MAAKLERLAEIDWTFAEAETRQGVHRIHPYPAKFIPQIPRQLIELFRPAAGDVILDPFCGCGTTLVEAQAADCCAIGIDLNPIAALISRVKTHSPASSVLSAATEVVSEARRCRAAIPPIPRVDHWFQPDVQQALANLVAQIGAENDSLMRDALCVALSSIIVRVSNQDGDTRYAAVSKDVSSVLVYDLFRKAAADLDRAFAEEYGGLFRQPRPSVSVLRQDILSVAPADLGQRVGLVITSPPYPNAYEYWLYHKYRMYWLGMDPLAVRSAELGARPHYFKKNHQTAADFERQMGQVFSLLAAVMNPGAFACFVVGRSVIHGKTIDNGSLLERAATEHGFVRLATVHRSIPATRKAFNPAHSTISTEAIVVFGR